MHPTNLSIGVDIGGTKILAALVDEDGKVYGQIHRETPNHDVARTERTLAEMIRELSEDNDQMPVGIGAAGWMDRQGKNVLFSPHLSWRNEPVRDRLMKLVGHEVTLVNDADAAGWAEHRFGAGRGESDMVCLTLGTGIGGAVILGGQIHRGKSGIAGEFGHQVIVPGGHRCACGNRGCWEQYASGNALGREGAELVRSKSPVAFRLREAVGDNPDAVTGADVTRLAANGDPACKDLIEDMGGWLGLGIANLASVLDPGTIVIGGGLGTASKQLVETAEETYRRSLSGRGYRPFAKICQAELGPAAGLIGAADLARFNQQQ
ncbi:ROK family protein [Glutamicibacter ectropisis]|uniref:ROK family protein n=1 Tax=Glutamicibacter ectropisis TaxID=3046593 RepID=A0AAU6WDF0_9MICC